MGILRSDARKTPISPATGIADRAWDHPPEGFRKQFPASVMSGCSRPSIYLPCHTIDMCKRLSRKKTFRGKNTRKVEKLQYFSYIQINSYKPSTASFPRLSFSMFSVSGAFQISWGTRIFYIHMEPAGRNYVYRHRKIYRICTSMPSSKNPCCFGLQVLLSVNLSAGLSFPVPVAVFLKAPFLLDQSHRRPPHV